jgi:hypothetical protein
VVSGRQPPTSLRDRPDLERMKKVEGEWGGRWSRREGRPLAGHARRAAAHQLPADHRQELRPVPHILAEDEEAEPTG